MLTQASKPYDSVAVREDGKVWSLERHEWCETKYDKESGYWEVHIRENQYISLHRLVAATFLKTPDGSDPDEWEVDHIDQDRSHNSVDNLRYLSHIHNMWNKTAANKSVRVTLLDGTETDYINYAEAAAALGINRSTVKRAVDNDRPLSDGTIIKPIEDIRKERGL